MTAVTAEAPEVATFTPLDRCDHSQAEQASVEFRTANGGTVEFCKHHADRYADTIILAGGSIVRDERHLLN